QPLIDELISISLNNDNISITSDKTTDFLDVVRENASNCKCADCDCEYPTVAIMSWL
ncbi:unnamed protein product, partial [Rotaria magnacalcarata]